MRYVIPMSAALVALTLMSPAQAGEEASPAFVPATDFELAQRDEPTQDERDADEERRDRAEERRERAEARRQRAAEREARSHDEERERANRDEERDDYRRVSHRPQGRAWIGIGAGAGASSIAVPCSSNPNGPKDCTQSGGTGTYTANFTISGPYTALRVRGIREQDRGEDKRTAYEEAVLIGSRFGTSNWYGLVGAGRVLHADDKHPEPTSGFAWEILFAPSSASALGMELSFQGELGSDVDFAAINLGMRFGALR